MNMPFIQIIGWVVIIGLFAGAILLYIFAMRYLRGIGDSELPVAEEYDSVCPNCHSNRIYRISGNAISPFPGYSCSNCKALLRTPKSGLAYFLILLLGAGLVLVSLYFFQAEGKLAIEFILIGGVAAGYCFLQLLRRQPRRIPKSESEIYQKQIYQSEDRG